ncbi:TetR/AcrR family transcriptional regulator [Profundibacter sp.]
MRTRKSAEDRKSEIELTTLKLAFKHGPSQVTTGMIARELGLTQPAIYRHYPTKDDIWVAVAEFLGAEINRNIAAAKDPSLSPTERLEKLVLGHMRLVRKYPALPEFMLIRGQKNGQVIVQNSIQIATGKFRNAIEEEVKAAVADGTFRKNLDPTDAAALIFGVIQSLVLRMLVTRKPEILAKDGERLLELQLSGFTA